MIKKGLVISVFLFCFLFSIISVPSVYGIAEFVADISDGETKAFHIGDVLGFNLFDGRHTFLVTGIKGDVVSVKLADPVRTADMVVGEEKRFDLNDDGVYDVYVKILDIIPSGSIYAANVIVQTIALPVGSVVDEPVVEEVVSNDSSEENVSVNEIVDEEEESGMDYTWVIVGLVVVIVVAVYFLLRKRK